MREPTVRLCIIRRLRSDQLLHTPLLKEIEVLLLSHLHNSSSSTFFTLSYDAGSRSDIAYVKSIKPGVLYRFCKHYKMTPLTSLHEYDKMLIL